MPLERAGLAQVQQIFATLRPCLQIHGSPNREGQFSQGAILGRESLLQRFIESGKLFFLFQDSIENSGVALAPIFDQFLDSGLCLIGRDNVSVEFRQRSIVS